ncbi:MAG: carboxypeptidase regulatory-like domain-containing protein [Ferruginibacter sp.]
MHFKKIIAFLIAVIAVQISLTAQVTTSSVSGFVKNSTGESITGSTVQLTHTPTGTTYKTASGRDGRFNFVNLMPGGPYTIEVTNVGYGNYSEANVNLPLGENTRMDVVLSTSATVLTDVVVTAAGSSRKKTGASTSIGKQQIAALPTLSRSLQDYTRLTPQANGNSFGGVSNRYNNITIDGAVNNDVFGLSGSGTPGGQAATTPISLDAIQEIQVVLAPYDVSYGNFTGGGVNAVTRSGTNKLEGSVYYFIRNENTIGKDPVTRIKATAFDDKQYGMRLGGPIIKNKLFFFLSGEMARRNSPTLFNAGDSNALLSVAEASQLADTLKNRYGYDAGAYNAFDAETQSNKAFARLDWNIRPGHQLTLRHNYIKAFDDNISRSPTFFRYGNNAYRFNNTQNITVAELRSRFGSRFSNNLLIGKHVIRDFRSTYGSLFPSIEISKGAGTVQLGSERSSAANELDQDIFEITDNFKIFKNKHTFTIGTHNEFFKFRNLFINNYNGRWRFGSLSDFYGNFPRQLDVTYSADKATNARPSAQFDASQLGFYIQDEIQVNSKFKLTMGLRADMPVINSKPANNRAVDSTFAGKYSTSFIPNKQLLWAPRVGFNYDVEGNKSTVVRGGIGVFTGRVPFVWISNQFSNTGLLLKTISQTDNTPATAPFTVNNGNGFNPNVDQQSTLGTGGTTYEVNLIDKNFKMPQVMRVNLAADKKLPGNINLTFEGIFSKTLNNIAYTDVNLTPAVGIVDQAYNNGFDKRIAYAASATARRINPLITNAILISNSNKGYTMNLGFTVNRTSKSLFTQLAYNYNISQDVNSGASSTALSQWEFVQVVGNPNTPQLATSNYQLKHRITGILSYNIEYAKHFKTSVSLFYNGNSGSPFTYLVNGDLNSDGRFGNDLLYVPADASQIKFVDRLNSAGTAIVSTAAEQAAAFEEFIKADKYLSSRRGKYTERNGRSTPWEHVIDARIAQDFFVNMGGNKHDVQLTLDIFNLTNLIDKSWGRQYSVGNQAYNLLTTINRTTGAFAGKGYNFTPQTPWGMNFGSRWQGQFGIRYSFN